MPRYYAGIGSRSTPPFILRTMTRVAERLRARGFILRSGGANGADSAFEAGAGDAKEIYLPWPRFNGNNSPLSKPSPEAFEMAAQVHPAWDRCSRGARALHARNCHQVLGADLATPVEFVLCWTPSGSESGGTGQAIRIAHKHDIRVLDFGADPVPDVLDSIASLL